LATFPFTRRAVSRGLDVHRVSAQMIGQMLASREIDPSGGFIQLPIARLSEAVILARTMMVKGNLQAMDRVDERTRPLSRYSAGPSAEAAAPPRLAEAPLDLAGSGTLRCRREIFRLTTA
jgi:hypothetical protein